jgi:hypothetical protein
VILGFGFGSGIFYIGLLGGVYAGWVVLTRRIYIFLSFHSWSFSVLSLESCLLNIDHRTRYICHWVLEINNMFGNSALRVATIKEMQDEHRWFVSDFRSCFTCQSMQTAFTQTNNI